MAQIPESVAVQLKRIIRFIQSVQLWTHKATSDYNWMFEEKHSYTIVPRWSNNTELWQAIGIPTPETTARRSPNNRNVAHNEAAPAVIWIRDLSSSNFALGSGETKKGVTEVQKTLKIKKHRAHFSYKIKERNQMLKVVDLSF